MLRSIRSSSMTSQLIEKNGLWMILKDDYCLISSSKDTLLDIFRWKRQGTDYWEINISNKHGPIYYHFHKEKENGIKIRLDNRTTACKGCGLELDNGLAMIAIFYLLKGLSK